MAATEHFFRDLAAFTDPRDVCEPRHTELVPDDWIVCVTDVRGSTQAIEAGRYKEVNLVGAACITAAVNAAGGVALPYIFGGDGATVLFPASIADAVETALLGVQATAARQFGLELRVGCVPVATLAASGHATRVGKLRVSEHVAFAMLAGDGPARAEVLIKEDARWRLTRDPERDPDLSGLQCRWEPLAPRRGEMLSGLVKVAARPGGPAVAGVYRQVIDEIERIAGAQAGLNPAGPDTLRLTMNPSHLRAESRFMAPHAQGPLARLGFRLRIWVFALIGRIFMALGLRARGVRWGEYKAEAARHTDYWKYDDTLRFVIDVSPDEHARLEAWLGGREAAGDLAYGLHASPTAIMTCFVVDLAGQHIHFVDGGDGGYAMASKQLKAKRGLATPHPDAPRP